MSISDQTIIIKKVKKAGHAHHGGAWKIAYADFVTAMMAFFLLMWLINMTTVEQKQGLADYFAPTAVSLSTSGAGGIMGGTSMEDSGAQRSGAQVDITDPSPTPPQPPSTGTSQGDLGGVIMENGSARQPTSDSEYDLTSAERQEFHSAAASIRQAWQAMPELTEYQDNILVEVTEDGLDIQILDQKGRRMFPEGSKYPIEATRAAIAAISPILQRLNMQISISGHTAAGGLYPNPRYGAWELSSDRANVVRSILGEFGLSEDRIKSVIGRATDQPFFPNDAFMAANERVHITVRRDAPPVPVGLAP